MIAVSNVGIDIDGRLLAKQVNFEQVGNVFLFNTTDGFIPVQLNQTIDGDRRFERFGTRIRVFQLLNCLSKLTTCITWHTNILLNLNVDLNYR